MVGRNLFRYKNKSKRGAEIEGVNGVKDDEERLTLQRRKSFVGLVNQGATCYLNSLLQTLFHTSQFKKALYSWQYGGVETDGEVEECIPFQLQTLFARLEYGIEQQVRTTDLTKSFGWTSRDALQQHDVQEMSKILFDALEQHKESECDKVTKIFEGELINFIQCLRCKRKSCRKETFQDISLAVEDEPTCDQGIPEALNQYVESELLTGENKYHCEHCDKKVDAKKGVGFLKFPNVLILHLKRFVFDWNTETRHKVQSKVKIPMELEMTHVHGLVNADNDDIDRNSTDGFDEEPLNIHPEAKTSSDTVSSDDSLSKELEQIERNEKGHPTLYELIGVMVHVGSANSGHYYTIVKTNSNSDRPQWYEFNDVRVTDIEAADVERMCNDGMLANGGAYMMIYSKKTNETLPQDDPIECEREENNILEFNPAILATIERENNKTNMENEEREMIKLMIKLKVLLKPGLGVPVLESDNLLPAGEAFISANIRASNILHVKKQARSVLLGSDAEKLPLEDLVLRRYYLYDECIGEALLDDETPLVDIGVNNSTVLLLDRKESETGDAYCYSHEELQLKLSFWDINEKCSVPVCAWYDYKIFGMGPSRSDYKGHDIRRYTSLEPLQISGGSQCNLKHLRSKIEQRLNIPGDIIQIYKVKKGNSKDILLELTNESLSLKEAYDVSTGDTLILGLSPEQSIPDSFQEQFELLDIYFNDPSIAIAKNSPVKFDMSIRLKKTDTIYEAKRQMLNKIGLKNFEDFHLSLSEKVDMLKDETTTLEGNGVTDHSVLYVGKGEPLNPGEYLFRIYTFHPENEKIKFKLVCKFPVSEGTTVASLYKSVMLEMKKKDATKYENVDIDSIVLREKSTRGNGLGTILKPGNNSIRSSIKGLSDRKRLILEIRPKDGTTESRFRMAYLNDNGLVDMFSYLSATNPTTWGDLCNEVTVKVSEYSKTGHRFSADDDIRVALLPVEHKQINAHLLTNLTWNNLNGSTSENKYSSQMNIFKFPIKAKNNSVIIVCEKHPGNILDLLDSSEWCCNENFENMKEPLSIPEPPKIQIAKASKKAGNFVHEPAPVLLKKKFEKQNSDKDKVSVRSDHESLASDDDCSISSSKLNKEFERLDEKDDDFWAGATPAREGMFEINSYSVKQTKDIGNCEGEGDDSESSSSNHKGPPEEETGTGIPILNFDGFPHKSQTRFYHKEFMPENCKFSDSSREAAKEERDEGLVQPNKTNSLTSKISNTKSTQHCSLNEEEQATVGAKVFAKATHWNMFFSGVVFSRKQKETVKALDIETKGNFLFTIDFDDGDRLEHVPIERIRIVDESSKTVDENSNEHEDDDGTQLCPTNKKQRKKERLATRDLRLSLMYTDKADSDASVHNFSKLRARTSPTKSGLRMYMGMAHGTDEHTNVEPLKQNVQKLFPSKTHRLSTLKPLSSDTRATTMPGRVRSDETDSSSLILPSRLPKLNRLKPLERNRANINSTNVNGSKPASVATPQYNQKGRKLITSESSYDFIPSVGTLEAVNQSKLVRPICKRRPNSKEKLQPLPQL